MDTLPEDEWMPLGEFLVVGPVSLANGKGGPRTPSPLLDAEGS